MRRFVLIAAAQLALSAALVAYVATGHTWPSSTVGYYVNPASVWVTPADALAAVQQAAGAWSLQSQANVKLAYAGPTSGGALIQNGKNEVFFRNDSSASGFIAETYWWWDGTGRLVDADVVFHEGAYHFYVGAGCDAGIYVENVGTHEFGHVLGLNHSDVGTATMYYAEPYCDRTQMTLDPDDVAGIEALYPPSGTTTPPPPTTKPPNNGHGKGKGK